MLKGQKKHIDKEQGKTKHEAPRSAVKLVKLPVYLIYTLYSFNATDSFYVT